jgi:hypothetical protein
MTIHQTMSPDLAPYRKPEFYKKCGFKQVGSPLTYGPDDSLKGASPEIAQAQHSRSSLIVYVLVQQLAKVVRNQTFQTA